jgi:hypothetical protein
VRPLRASAFANAAPLDGRGHRTRQTLLLISERNKLLAEAARFFPGAFDREIARQLRTALLRYQTGAWRRTRVETTCPTRHLGRLDALLWQLLRIRDATLSERTIRAVLGRTASASSRE